MDTGPERHCPCCLRPAVPWQLKNEKQLPPRIAEALWKLVLVLAGLQGFADMHGTQ